ncbi:glycoside hydrolase family 43 protein [Sphingomonas sp.]|uniref:glycoside hydrolase family 43 protein n=1 Tax=Sphingomonas sp. TaxID=28214 RepID=UPI003B3BA683
MHDVTRRTALAGIGATLSGIAVPAFAQGASDSVFLLSYFTDQDEGRAGLKLARSDDGYVFTPLGGGRGFLTPEVGRDKLMRDPHLLRAPDGLWHLVWTSDWFGPVIGHATSRDLVRWSAQQTIPVMTAFPGVRNSWAPETIYDARADDFVIIWSSSIDGRYGATPGSRFEGLKLRPYYTRTRDFRRFAPTKLLFDPGTDSIDFTFLTLADGSLRLIYKDETHDSEQRRWLVSRSAASPTGPFGPVSKPFTQTMTEGPTAIRMGDRYLVYYDVYEQGHFGAASTTDFVTWRDETDRVRFPKNARHGTVVRVPRVFADAIA